MVIIDPTVSDYQSLAAGVKPATFVHILNPNRDGIEQITEILGAKHSRIDWLENPQDVGANALPLQSIHIISHGSPGSLKLGNSTLNTENLEQYQDQLQQWQTALADNADINIYGCNVALGVTGQAFIQQLAHLTKADIAASTTPTGNEKLGGNWNLEFITGKIKSALAFSPEVTAAYTGVLGDGLGGVGTGANNLKLWLKADAITGATNSAAVGTWNDSSGNSIALSQPNAANQPIYKTAGLNNVPTLSFNGSSQYYEVAYNASLNPAQFTVITVTQVAGGTGTFRSPITSRNSGPQQGYILYAQDDNKWSSWLPQSPWNFATDSTALTFNTGYITSGSYNGSQNTLSVNGTQTSTALTTFIQNTSKPLRVGAGTTETTPNWFFNGDISEVILYDKALNNAERTLVDNYLGAKYNITISNDKYVGDTPANGDYDWNVAGIGKEANGTNISGNTTGGLIIDNGTFLKDNGDYLVAGQKDTTANPATLVTTDLPTGANNRLSRVWYLDKTDVNTNGGTANLTFDFSDSGLGGTPSGKYHLLYRSGTTGNFAYVNNATFTTNSTFSITGDQVTFNNVDIGLLNDGYYTLASKNNNVPLINTIANASINEDAAQQTITLTGISDIETATNALTLTATSDNTGLTGTPTITNNNNGTATLQYTPVANANGTANISVTVTDGDGGTVTKTFAVNVNAVNDAPSFTTTGNPAAVNEDAGAQTVTAWATFNPGAANESAQTATYTVSNISNAGLFATAPAIDANGNLTYTPAANVNGTSTFDVQVQDSGGTANGGVNTSTTQTFTITVNSVNDAPSFSNAGNQTLAAWTNTPQTVANWANTFVFGPADESSQAVQDFIVNVTSGSTLFTSLPDIANDGTLTYTPKGTPGTATISVQLQDNGGGSNTSTAATFTITIPPPTVNLSISPTTGTEAGTTAITVTATAAGPVFGNQTVDLALTGSATAADFAGTIPTQITIANGTSSGQVTFTIANDNLDEIDETANLTISNPSAGIQLGATTTGSFTITDNDTAGFDILPISGNTSEDGTQATFDIRLTSEPTANVTIGLSSSNTAEATVAPATLTFTPTNWNTYQTVTITGVDDGVADDDIAYQIITTPDTTTTDTNYNNLNPADVAVTNTDNDSPGVTIAQSAGSTEVTEGSTTDTYTVKLNTLPTGNVQITVKAEDAQAEVSLDGKNFAATQTLTFTNANGTTPQTVTVRAVDDAAPESNHVSSITHAITNSADTKYLTTMTVGGVNAHITDNDIRYTLTDSSPTITEGNSGTQQIDFTIERAGAINEASTIDFSFGGTAANTIDYNLVSITGTGVTTTGSTISFAANATQATVTVEIVGDRIDETDETLILSLLNATATGTSTI
ncbi:hypothetical protein AM228_28385, partial [Planktothricoides sp. SR001]|uniref:DUF4347 domain-containing protein n=1 Tax=Planktothricoides sp. SR001 TaxID=1705388 RepID=UPI0006C6BCFB